MSYIPKSTVLRDADFGSVTEIVDVLPNYDETKTYVVNIVVDHANGAVLTRAHLRFNDAGGFTAGDSLFLTATAPTPEISTLSGQMLGSVDPAIAPVKSMRMTVHPRRCGTILMESICLYDAPVANDGAMYLTKACYNGQVPITSVSIIFTVAPGTGGHYTTEMVS